MLDRASLGEDAWAIRIPARLTVSTGTLCRALYQQRSARSAPLRAKFGTPSRSKPLARGRSPQVTVRSRLLRLGPVALSLLSARAARAATSDRALACSLAGAPSTTGTPDSPP